MRCDDNLRITLEDGRLVDTELQVYRIPSIYYPKDPAFDELGLYLNGGGEQRCATVNMKHPTFAGTHDAIMRFVNEFAEKKLGSKLVKVQVW